MMSSISLNDVSIQLEHCLDVRGDYKAFTEVTATIRVKSKAAGSMYAVIIDRALVPENSFLRAMDEHSGQLQLIDQGTIFERWGR